MLYINSYITVISIIHNYLPTLSDKPNEHSLMSSIQGYRHSLNVIVCGQLPSGFLISSII